ncbi:hypothetical protein K2173_018383 [Erythroxylum novogranatense]|uniref:Piriformospora indica-insensitive protein 2 n=1 Tax=Erythroxylum novogranatense TaxID=1862640 RepID=A0AAV8UBK3_9ROSI|nr:hypothetical protein K2173_018383 [Erythroxylum novogranatense]
MPNFFSLPTLFLFLTLLFVSTQQQQPLLDSAEQNAVFEVLNSINSAVSWRSLFPDDLCLSAPHGVVCEYFTEHTPSSATNVSFAAPLQTVHIVELSFGYVSDYTPNPPCSPNSTLSPLLFTSFKYLRKLFFYKCFTGEPVLLPNITSFVVVNNLEELVFIENPALVGSLDVIFATFINLRRLVLTGNGVYGNISDGVGDLINVEEITLSRNQLSGGVSFDRLAKLKKLKVLDLSQNHFHGIVPESLGDLSQLLKLDLSSNFFSGNIPETLVNLQSLEFLDLSFNRFGKFGVPKFLGEMRRLKEVYLSGNLLGGRIPEIWEKLGSVSSIGFSNIGLVGNIPASMGLYLTSLSYLGLDDNKLEGNLPEEFGLLEFANEINLENNNLSGRVPFSVNFSTMVGQKLKLKGNSGLCIDKVFDLGYGKNRDSFGELEVCNKSDVLSPVLHKDIRPVSLSNSLVLGISSSTIWCCFCIFLHNLM